MMTYENMNYSNDNRGLRSSMELDDNFIDNLKKSYISQTIPISLIMLLICVILIAFVIISSIYIPVTFTILIFVSVLILFLFARILCILILSSKIHRGGFTWTQGTVTGYAYEGTMRNYHIYIIVNGLFYCMFWMNNLYSKGSDVYILSMRVFTSEENIMIRI